MHLSARHVSLKLSAGSKQEGSLALGLDLNPNSFTGNAYLHFHQYAPDKVLSLLYPDNDIKIDGAGFTMKSDFLFQNAETFSGTIEGTWPGFSLSAEKEIVSFRNGRIKSAIAFSPSRTANFPVKPLVSGAHDERSFSCGSRNPRLSMGN